MTVKVMVSPLSFNCAAKLTEVSFAGISVADSASSRTADDSAIWGCPRSSCGGMPEGATTAGCGVLRGAAGAGICTFATARNLSGGRASRRVKTYRPATMVATRTVAMTMRL
jgi:hypothetical protein